MRKIALVTALLLLSSIFVLAQSGGDQTPPGADMLGSDYLPSQGQLSEQSTDAAQNQRITGTYGNTKGYSGDPAYAGGSEYLNTQAISSTGAKGQQGEAAAIAGRTRAEDRQDSPFDTQVTGQGRLVSNSYLSGAYGQNNAGQSNQSQTNGARQQGNTVKRTNRAQRGHAQSPVPQRPR